eukprot:TRINITY_DN52116_c0_g1_i1.p1 TRINITY_DN52116_c0_g1~~TRINITY_DN52116_c0_g1_i1.p1  ORF type:complete len:559 (+),score=49.93 TRINITY_DN52116_c0_g1_i1:51-1727(+)
MYCSALVLQLTLVMHSSVLAFWSPIAEYNYHFRRTAQVCRFDMDCTGHQPAAWVPAVQKYIAVCHATFCRLVSGDGEQHELDNWNMPADAADKKFQGLVEPSKASGQAKCKCKDGNTKACKKLKGKAKGKFIFGTSTCQNCKWRTGSCIAECQCEIGQRSACKDIDADWSDGTATCMKPCVWDFSACTRCTCTEGKKRSCSKVDKFFNIGMATCGPDCTWNVQKCSVCQVQKGSVEVCKNKCTSLLKDPQNCGKCGKKCPGDEICNKGKCRCTGGRKRCTTGSGRICMNLKNSFAHCGACGNACRADQKCVLGQCEGKPAFTIEVQYDGPVPEGGQEFVEKAIRRWQNMITGDLPDITFEGKEIDDLLVIISFLEIDGVGKTLGQASPATVRNLPDGSPLGAPLRGFAYIDKDDFGVVSDTVLMAVLVHELGHVLGLGALWPTHGLIGTGEEPGDLPVCDEENDDEPSEVWYFGGNATAQYNLIFGVEGFVPVEAKGPAGTCGVHWDEAVFGHEMMSTAIAADATTRQPISKVTLGALMDLGYQVDLDAAELYEPPVN